MPNEKRAHPETVEAYLAALPSETRSTLAGLRNVIRVAAPAAKETLRFGMPTFEHHGLLVSFAAQKRHCTFYVMGSRVMDAHRPELAGFDLGKGCIRFPASKPLPASLVARLVKARVAENEAGLNE